MKRFFGSLALMGAMLVSLAQGAKADLVVNGSFETPVAPGPVNGAPPFVLPPWTANGPVALIHIPYIAPPTIFYAKDGIQYVDLSGGVDGFDDLAGSVSQTIATTVGQNYMLNFSVGAATARFGNSLVTLTINDLDYGTYTNDDPMLFDQWGWKDFTVIFTALESSSTFEFTNASIVPPSGPVNRTVGFDAVSLTAVPETETLAMWGLMGGFGVIFATRFNRKRLQARLA